MTFDLGLGANTTLKDAVMLGKAFEATRDVVTALRAYEAVRRPAGEPARQELGRGGARAGWENPIAARLHQGVLALGRYVFIGKEYERDLDFSLSSP